jgi:hypothetical protein
MVWGRCEFIRMTPFVAFDCKHEDHDATDQKNREVDDLG